MSIHNTTVIPELQVVADLADRASIRNNHIEPETSGVQNYVIGDDERIVTDSFERYLDVPRRNRGNTTVTDAKSFAKILELQADPADTILFANEHSQRVTAVLNAHGWRDWTITLDLQLAPEWKHWTGLNNKLVKQTTFAEHIEDGISAITTPSAADLMEIVQSFQATRSVNFESGVRLQSGDVAFRYHEETQAGAGQKGQLEVPETFTLQLPVYRHGPGYMLEARLRYRISQEGLGLGYKLQRLDDIVAAAFSDAVDEIAENTSHPYPTVHGPAPHAVDAING